MTASQIRQPYAKDGCPHCGAGPETAQILRFSRHGLTEQRYHCRNCNRDHIHFFRREGA